LLLVVGLATASLALSGTASFGDNSALASSERSQQVRLTFTTTRDGNYEIYAVGEPGRANLNLSNSPGLDWLSAVSPDGSRIAFESDRSGNKDVFVMDADGSHVVNVTNNPANDGQPSWSPDGRRIVFNSNRGGDVDVWVLDLRDGSTAQMTIGGGDQYPTGWSPDGRTILYHNASAEVYALDVKTKASANLTNNTAFDAGGTFLPDGTVVFSSNRDGNEEIYSMWADGTHVTRLTFDSRTDQYPFAFSGRIAFDSDRMGGFELYLMDVSGANIQRVTVNSALDFYPRSTM